jgi:type I restriction enzyme S subunit
MHIDNLKNEHIDDLLIPLPPLAEQSRIAAILDQVEVLRRKRREALERLNRLTRAVFIELFGVPGDALENGEPLRNLAELINGDRSSNYPSGDDLVESGIAFLNTKTISDGRIDIEFANFISEEKFRSLSRGKLKRNNLVINLRDSLRKCAEFEL